MFAAGVAIPAMTHDLGYAADWNAGNGSEQLQREQVIASQPKNVPTWDAATAEAFPRCEAKRDGVLYADVVVVDQRNDVGRVTFDRAWSLVTDDTKANDVWIIGGCS
jgi:hypothetical protein